MGLQYQIQDLLHASIRQFDLKENDAVSFKTLKLIFVGEVLESLDLSWTYLISLFKTHTPVHPEIAREMKEIGDEEVNSALAQIFVRNEKLVRIVKGLTQQGHDVEALLAVDGLGGSHSPNFEHKYYVGNLRFGRVGDSKSAFDNEPEYKRKHVQTVRQLFKKLEKVPAPEKQIYQILRQVFHEIASVKLPEIEVEEKMDKRLQNECCQYYKQTMGKENIENLAKTIKRNRGEKRTLEREDDIPSSHEKR